MSGWGYNNSWSDPARSSPYGDPGRNAAGYNPGVGVGQQAGQTLQYNAGQQVQAGSGHGYSASHGQRMAALFEEQEAAKGCGKAAMSANTGSVYNKDPEAPARVCMRFLKGDCSYGRACQHLHPEDAEEVVGWVSTFLSRQCQNKNDCKIPGCLYGHPSQAPGDAPPAGWQRGIDGTPPPAQKVKELLKRKWASMTADSGGNLYSGEGSDDDPHSVKERCERFIAANKIDERAGGALLELAPEIQARILKEGPIWGGRPSAGLMARINKLTSQLKADGGLPAHLPVGSVILPTTTITSASLHGRGPSRITVSSPWGAGGSMPQSSAGSGSVQQAPELEDGLPQGLMDMASAQLNACMPVKPKIAISHVQLPGEPAPPPIQSLGQLGRTFGGHPAPAPKASVPKPLSRPGLFLVTPLAPPVSTWSLTWEDITKLSVLDLRKRITEAGATIPAGAVEKDHLCAILRQALGLTPTPRTLTW